MCVWTHSRGVKSACLCIKTTAWYVATIGWRPETESQEKGYVLSDKNTQRERESERNHRSNGRLRRFVLMQDLAFSKTLSPCDKYTAEGISINTHLHQQM